MIVVPVEVLPLRVQPVLVVRSLFQPGLRGATAGLPALSGAANTSDTAVRTVTTRHHCHVTS